MSLLRSIGLLLFAGGMAGYWQSKDGLGIIKVLIGQGCRFGYVRILGVEVRFLEEKHTRKPYCITYMISFIELCDLELCTSCVAVKFKLHCRSIAPRSLN